jgi:hypothetical protein
MIGLQLEKRTVWFCRIVHFILLMQMWCALPPDSHHTTHAVVLDFHWKLLLLDTTKAKIIQIRTNALQFFTNWISIRVLAGDGEEQLNLIILFRCFQLAQEEGNPNTHQFSTSTTTILYNKLENQQNCSWRWRGIQLYFDAFS